MTAIKNNPKLNFEDLNEKLINISNMKTKSAKKELFSILEKAINGEIDVNSYLSFFLKGQNEESINLVISPDPYAPLTVNRNYILISYLPNEDVYNFNVIKGQGKSIVGTARNRFKNVKKLEVQNTPRGTYTLLDLLLKHSKNSNEYTMEVLTPYFEHK